ncbi:MAG: AI-2E family transporter [Candidatus Saccharibacteria bacterium]
MNHKQRRALTIAVIIAIIFGAYFLRGYVTVIALAAIFAYLFNPIYKWLLIKSKHRKGLSVGITLFIAFITILIPVVVVMAITVEQALQIADVIKKSLANGNSVGDIIQSTIDYANRTIDKIPGTPINHISSGQAFDWIKNNSSAIIKSSVNIVKNLAGGLPALFTKVIIFIYIFMSVLKNQDSIIRTIKKLNPLNDKTADLYLARMGAMTTAMVKGQFVIAILCGLVDAGLLYAVGVPYFIFWFVLITFLSIIPLGGGIIVIPIGIIMILTGNIWQGIVLIAGHILIVTNIDNVLRPRFVPDKARLDSALTILSVFAGIAMFGFLGIIIGPVLMIVITTTIQVYVSVANHNEDAEPTNKI